MTAKIIPFPKAQRRFVTDGKNPLEICVVCEEITNVRAETPTDERNNYVDGSGQLCSKCYRELYGGIR